MYILQFICVSFLLYKICLSFLILAGRGLVACGHGPGQGLKRAGWARPKFYFPGLGQVTNFCGPGF